MKKIALLLLAASLASAAFSGAPPALQDGEPDVLQGAVLWLDACDFKGVPQDVCFEMDDGWRGRGACTCSTAEVDTARPPILRKDKSGLPYVDFGKYSSGAGCRTSISGSIPADATFRLIPAGLTSARRLSW